ncbi:hypothetical protein L484_023847 [Morus notabilis]|uniref:Uncharacterized protein n=1 Tax=Morus notabilis TaxID=981085 RepID=W9RFS5_9ROSA|nr:hypothetical protein L484_023847 [Morus notabilis]
MHVEPKGIDDEELVPDHSAAKRDARELTPEKKVGLASHKSASEKEIGIMKQPRPRHRVFGLCSRRNSLEKMICEGGGDIFRIFVDY